MRLKDAPEKLRPYMFHGIRFTPKGKEHGADCPFCDRDKFSVNEDTGLWRCWSCAKGSSKGGGNVYTFLNALLEISEDLMNIDDYRSLVSNRGLLDAQSCIEWRVVKSFMTGDYIVPGYNPDGSLTSLYRNIKQPTGGYRLIPTPTLGHQIHGMNLWDKNKNKVYIFEGPWDAITFWEILTRVKETDQGYKMTANRNSSLYSQANVIAQPGCEVFLDHWLPLCEGKDIYLMHDSDHPKKHPKTKAISPGAGIRAMERLTEKLCNSATPPNTINYLKWGDDGYDPTKKSGYDVRDFITKG